MSGVAATQEVMSSSYRGTWSRIKTLGRANGVLSYFSLRDEGAAVRPPKDQGGRESTEICSNIGAIRETGVPIYQVLTMDGCTKDPQLEEGENQNTGEPGTGMTPLGGTSAPVEKVQEGPSPTLFNEGPGGAGLENSQMRQEDTPQMDPLGQGAEVVRLETRSRSKSKSVKSKPQSVRASRRKSSSDSGYDTVSDNSSEDLSIPYRWPKPMPFTSRITRFIYHRRAKLPANIRVYKGNNTFQLLLRR
ncbi:hypothetical protein Tco_0756545 [Tanacetum coccineum]